MTMPTQTRTRQPQPTERQQQVLDLLGDGHTVKEVAEELGVSTNAVYLQITKMRTRGLLPKNYTATGRPPREVVAPGQVVLEQLMGQAAAPSAEVLNHAGNLALVQELVRTRDDLLAAAARITVVLPAGL